MDQLKTIKNELKDSEPDPCEAEPCEAEPCEAEPCEAEPCEADARLKILNGKCAEAETK